MFFCKENYLLTCVTLVAAFWSGAAAAAQHNSEGYDVRLVAAYFDQKIVTIGAQGDNTVQLSDCREDARHPRHYNGVHIYDAVSMDCRDAASSALGMPVVGRFWVYANVQPGTMTPVNDQTVESAKLVRIFLASRKDAVRHAAGIGFYFGFNMSFVEKDRLSVFADATMQGSNDAAEIYQFAGLVTGTAFESVSFKAYMEFHGPSDSWRVWENLESRAGSSFVEGSVWGSGNYILRANRTDRVKFTDVIHENHLINVPVALPAIASLNTFQREPDISSVSVYPDRREMELLPKPYVSTYPLRFSETQSFVQAGTKLWVRFSDQIANGRDVKMFWSLNGGETQEASNYLGGNCYGFIECFAIPVAEAAAGTLDYWFTMTAGDGTVSVHRNGNQNFQIQVRPAPGIVIALNKSDVVIDRPAPDVGTYALKYDPIRAIELLRSNGKVADELSLVAIVNSESGISEFPLGTVRSWTDGEMRIHYNADMVLTPHNLQVPGVLHVEVRITSRVRGIPDGEYTDTVGVVTVD